MGRLTFGVAALAPVVCACAAKNRPNFLLSGPAWSGVLSECALRLNLDGSVLRADHAFATTVNRRGGIMNTYADNGYVSLVIDEKACPAGARGAAFAVLACVSIADDRRCERRLTGCARLTSLSEARQAAAEMGALLELNAQRRQSDAHSCRIDFDPATAQSR